METNEYYEWLEALSKYSDEEFYNINQLQPKKFICFSGNESDFNKYQETLIAISKTNKEILKIDKVNFELLN